jgi:phospholipid/cholesterol/gamma-HCH transport system ATP-binding protein
VAAGRACCILGRSGTGKSVTLKHVVGLIRPDAGRIYVEGEEITRLNARGIARVRRRMGFLFQNAALFDSISVGENVAFPMRRHTRMRDREIRERAMQKLESVGLARDYDKMPGELSGGMRKRAGFARALVLDPAIVLFDEPDSGLDPVRTALLCELIREVHEENGGCYLVISHDLGTARRIADFLAVLWKGRIVESGPADELFNSDNEFVAQFLNADVQGPLAMD